MVARAVSDPAAVLAGLGEPSRAGVDAALPRRRLTILNVVWGPRHDDHAAQPPDVGGDRRLYRPRGQHLLAPPAGHETAAGSRPPAPNRWVARDAEPLGRDIIHSVTNPLPRLTGAIHVYGGDFFAVKRSEWDPESLRERAYDFDLDTPPVRGSERRGCA